jgi:serine/threonine protein kinase
MLNSIDEIEFLSKNELGEGAYSKVFHVRHRKTKKHYALKHVNLIRLMFLKYVKRIARIYEMKSKSIKS